ncbi:hypothetical protein ACFYXS_22960 [Streptomyces sp. NPDC002574]|uniref:hypothetical protein n=1 Tax=Streptomyces sp. NPDC002574 TaxID=3364652 RepID=UPI00367C172E
MLLGDKRRFAVEVGEWSGPELRRVDLWVAGQWATCDDNTVFVPQFLRSVEETVGDVRGGHGSDLSFAGVSAAEAHRRIVAGTGDEETDWEVRTRFVLFDAWGPTTDNVRAFLFRDGDAMVITMEFRRPEHLLEHPDHVGRVFAAEIGAAECTGILEDLVAALHRCPGSAGPGLR